MRQAMQQYAERPIRYDWFGIKEQQERLDYIDRRRSYKTKKPGQLVGLLR